MIKVNLHLAMAKAGVKKQTELAQRASLTKSQVSRLFQEKTTGITWATLSRLCEALNCGVGDLLEFVPDEKKEEVR